MIICKDFYFFFLALNFSLVLCVAGDITRALTWFNTISHQTEMQNTTYVSVITINLSNLMWKHIANDLLWSIYLHVYEQQKRQGSSCHVMPC